MQLNSKVVWITGASSGIGAALAEQMSAAGARVILSGRDHARLAASAGRCGGEALTLPFDATDLDGVPAVVERAQALSGKIDMLVNNAGIAQQGMATETGFEIYRHVMEVDFFAPLRLTQLVLPHMLAHGEGHIVAVSSIAGAVGVPTYSAYGAAKHAMVGYFDALRAELALSGIDVTTVLPGYVRTGIQANTLDAGGRPVGLAQVANGALGHSAGEAATIILAGLREGRREIAFGMPAELALISQRRSDPEASFRDIAMAPN